MGLPFVLLLWSDPISLGLGGWKVRGREKQNARDRKRAKSGSCEWEGDLQRDEGIESSASTLIFKRATEQNTGYLHNKEATLPFPMKSHLFCCCGNRLACVCVFVRVKKRH